MKVFSNVKQSVLGGVNGFLKTYLASHEYIQHTISLGIFGVFATSYMKVVVATKDFVALDWGWVVLLGALAGYQHLQSIKNGMNGNGDTNGGKDKDQDATPKAS